MGGDVTVESTPTGGSCFVVALQVSAVSSIPQAVDTPAHRVPSMPMQRPSASKLLVVDDHPVNLEVIMRQLELLGLSAELAEDGAEALARWRKTRHAIVLLDLHMPVLDGFGLAKAIRQEEAEYGIPRCGLIAVTADALKGEDARCFASGMDGFLSKPVSLDALARTVGRWIPALVPDVASAEAACGALFDPEALRGLFGADATRLAALVQSFADSATRDLAALRAAPNAEQLAAVAHRLNGAARMAGARLLAAQAVRVEAAGKAGDFLAGQSAADEMENLLAKTLHAMRSV
jgi:CheY-like chemotaxis protein